MRCGTKVCRLLSISIVLLFTVIAHGQVPDITTQPTGADVCGSDDSITFTVTATGAAPLRYQWRKDGVDISGATSFGYSIAAPVSGDAGDYDVVVSNDEGSATSDVATLVFADVAPTIFDQPEDETQCLGNTAIFSVSAAGDALTYQWRKGGVDLDGETSASLVIDPIVDDDGGDYEVVVSNPCGEVTSDTVTLFVDFVPEISTDPLDLTVCIGDMATLTVVAAGGANLDYQWRKDGDDLVGETSDTLTIATTTSDDSGDYDVVLSNPCGTTTSAAATLTIADAPVITVQPFDQTVCVGDVTTFSVTATSAISISYQWRVGGVNIPGGTEATLTIDPTEAADAGDYDVLVLSQCGTTTSASATLTVPDDPLIEIDIADQSACVGDEVTLSVTAFSIIPLTYQWTLDGVDLGGETSDTLTIASAALADAGDYQVTITNTCGTVASSIANLLVAEAPTIDDHPISRTVCEGDPVTLTVAASSLVPVDYQWRFDGDDIDGATSDSLVLATAELTDDGDYDVVVTNDCGSVTSLTATLTVAEVPQVDEDIADRTVCAGDDVTFTVAATSILPQVYQWSRNGIDLDGETSTTLELLATTSADSGIYELAITNACGTVTSSPATLVVAEIPEIDTQPGSTTLCSGEDLELTVEASSRIALRYQWFKDDVEIEGAAGSALSLAPALPGDSGDYHVVVTNDCGSVTSTTATVTVAEAPIVESAPVETAVCIGDAASLTVTASSAIAFTYQWRRDGEDLDGETTDTLSFASATLDDAGDYEVVISNVCGTTTTTPVALIVGDVPVILTEPQGADAQSQDEVTLSVTVESAVPLTYQWVKDGEPLEGATDGTLVIAFMALADVGDYHVEISSLCGDVVSATATLTLPEFRRGDVNRDDQVNIADLVYSISYLFNEGPEPGCMDSADLNDDGLVDVADVIFEIRYLFLGSSVPPSPGAEECGPDTEDPVDDLDCLVIAPGCA